MILTYKYKLRLTANQSNRLFSWMGACRYLYNCALETKIEAYRKLGKNVSRFELDKELPAIKKDLPWMKDVNAQSLQCVLKRLDEAYQAFFRRGNGFPRFASKRRWNMIEFPQRVAVQNGRIWLPKIGLISYYNSRPLNGIIRTTKVIKDTDGWYICLSCEVEPRPVTSVSENQVVGVDMGVAHFLTTSDGEMVDNPRWFQSYSRELRVLQRSVARKKKGSGKRAKAVVKLRKLHTKIKRKRADHHHKLSTRLVKENQVIAIEDLKLKNMTRSAKGTLEAPGKNVAQKRGLNRSMIDLGIGSFFQMLEYKAEYFGREVVKVDPRCTSQTCNACGHRSGENRKTQSQFVCVKCGYTANADINAAQNIRGRAGLALGNVELLGSCVGRESLVPVGNHL